MSLKQQILFKAAEFDLDQPLIKTYESLTGRLDWTPDISVGESIQEGRHVSQQHEGDILLPLFIITEHMCIRTFVLGYAFQVRGYRPIIIYNINTLPEKVDSTESNTYDMSVAKTKSQFRWFAERFPVNCVSIGDVLQHNWEMPDHVDVPRDPDTPYNYRGIDISGAAMATARKDLRRYSIDLHNDRHYRTYCKYLIRGMMIAESVQRLIDQHEFEALLAWDVSYTRGRIPLKIFHNKGIKAYSHGNSYTRGTVGYGNMRNRRPNWHFMDTEVVSDILESPLSTRQQKQVEEVINKRASGDPDHNEHAANTYSSIDASESTTVGVFSHLLWDGALEPDRAIYPNFYNWVADTIEVGKNIENTEFFLKAHPAEAKNETNETLAEWINDTYKALPENFTFLPPDTDVDTYKLIEKLDAGIVYSSTVGLEMALQGVPVLTGGYPPYLNLGITCDPDTKQEYRSELEGITEFESDSSSVTRARRFAYLLFVARQFEFPQLHEYFAGDEVKLRHDEVVEKLDPVVTQILNGEEVLAEEAK